MTNLKFVKLNLHGNNTFENTKFCEKNLTRKKIQTRMSNGGTNVHTKKEIVSFDK